MSKLMAAPDLVVNKRPSPPAVAVLAVSESESSDSFTSPATTVPSSPASLESDRRSFSISSLKNRAWRSFSTKDRDPTPDRGHSFRGNARRLSKSRPLSSSSHIEPPSRRGSAISDDHSRISLSTADSLSLVNASSSSSAVDWKTERIEGHGPLETDTVLLKTKTPYLVVTANYVIKTKSRADASALLPDLAPEGTKREASDSAPEPQLAIPMDAIVSVFAAESTRPSFGLEIWWKHPLAGHALCRSDFFFTKPAERNEQMHHITRAMRASQQEENSAARHSRDVRTLLERIHEAEEPRFHDRKPDIFPVVPRGATRKEYMPKLEDATKKSQEGPAFYLVVGTYLCHLVEIQRGKGGEAVCRHKTYGLVTLECFKGEWIHHEERFNITFRDPFKPPITLELASRNYRQIIRVLGTADRFLKPAWPQLWQTLEIFRVSGLKEPQYLVPKEDFGSFKRTLDAYLAAYRCDDVDWEINWKTRLAPEFRLLPGKRGPYSPLQLLAVLRALRYNDYFNSLSFRDVDLAVLYGLQDSSVRKVNVGYLSRTCVALGHDEVEMLRLSPVLHQEFHALAFCSETIRQIDFGNCTKSLASRLAQQKNQTPSVQFFAPILSLLRSGITKCNRLILGGNILPKSDVNDLAMTMNAGAIQALDVSYCGLDDASLRDMIVVPITEYPGLLQSLSVSGNPGRLPAHILPGLLQYLTDIRELNLSGSIQAESYIDGSLLPFASLERMEQLEELDISGYKIDEATFNDLERFLEYRAWRLDQNHPVRFHKLTLNHCGITGTLAARLFHAIGANRNTMHLSLSGNPIEDGIGGLAAALTANHGPTSLALEMIEFRHEPSYLLLLQSLTTTSYLTHLSLAGTAPTPSLSSSSSSSSCSQDLLTTLHNFFSQNTSLKTLDLSGFSGKLDDGQLPRGFGRALAGLTHNKTLTHLRIRNQNLHDDAGTLGAVLKGNDTLQAVDCRDNNFALSSVRFLVDSLRGNESVVEFPFPEEEREGVWRGVLGGLQRKKAVGSGVAGKEKEKDKEKELAKLKAEEMMLREVLNGVWRGLEGRLRENRLKLKERQGVDAGRVRHRHQRSASSGLGVGVLTPGVLTPGEDGWPGFDGAVGEGGGGPSRSSSTGSGLSDSKVVPIIRSEGMLEMEVPFAPVSYGHQLGAGHGTDSVGSNGVVVGGMESPPETLDPVSEVETPVEEPVQSQVQVRVVDAEAGAPRLAEATGADGDDFFRKMMEDFRRAGFEV